MVWARPMSPTIFWARLFSLFVLLWSPDHTPLLYRMGFSFLFFLDCLQKRYIICIVYLGDVVGGFFLLLLYFSRRRKVKAVCTDVCGLVTMIMWSNVAAFGWMQYLCNVFYEIWTSPGIDWLICCTHSVDTGSSCWEFGGTLSSPAFYPPSSFCFVSYSPRYTHPPKPTTYVFYTRFSFLFFLFRDTTFGTKYVCADLEEEA